MLETLGGTEDMLKRIGDGSMHCAHCGATIKPGQPHSALAPFPHQTVAALVVAERPPFRDGSHAEVDHDGACCHQCPGALKKGVGGRILARPLVTNPDTGYWMEAKA